jgi:hypothetical protein
VEDVNERIAEIAASAQSLAAVAEELNRLVRRFTLAA